MFESSKRACVMTLVFCAALAHLPLVQASEGKDLKPVRTAAIVESVPKSRPGAPVVRIDKIRARPSNETVGKRLGGLFCGSVNPFVFDARVGSLFARTTAEQLAREMNRAGYPLPNESAFENEAKIDYVLALTLTDMQVEACGELEEIHGGIWLKADIELWSPRDRRVVYRASHEGHATAPRSKPTTWRGLTNDAGTALARNLLADDAFVKQAAQQPQMLQADTSSDLAPQSPLAIAQKQTDGASLHGQLAQLQSSVATLFSGSGSASTFLLAADGHWLTAQHAVGDAKFVKIKLPSGRELLGEVLRTDRRRDVALIKTEPVALAPLTVSDRDAAVGGDVYALGSPLGERLEGTVTRGIVSSYREIEGQRLLQSDVKILPGSSGGPLVDQRGAVVGLARGAIGDTSTSMNLFVPISEVLKALSITTR